MSAYQLNVYGQTKTGNRGLLQESHHKTHEVAMRKLHSTNVGDLATLFAPEATYTFEANRLGGWRQIRVVFGWRAAR